jgi:hypothetical protein
MAQPRPAAATEQRILAASGLKKWTTILTNTVPGEAFAQNLSEFGAPQGKSCFANVVSTWTFAL